jgi:nicotinamide-nucleotide amidase
MQRMLHESVIPLLVEKTEVRGVIRSLNFNIFGPAEAEVDEKLHGLNRPEQGLYLGICVTFPWIRVTLRAEAAHEEAALALLQQAADVVRERLEDWIFSEGKQGMDELVAELFRNRGLTLSLAESCTGGMIAQRLTAIPGSSAWFMEGAVTYSNAAKVRQLGVSEELLEKHGAVSSQVAEAMATDIRSKCGSDLALAVTGIAGPDGGTDEKPVGTVFISLVSTRGCRTERFRFYGSRDNVRVLTAWTALDWLRRYLLA